MNDGVKGVQPVPVPQPYCMGESCTPPEGWGDYAGDLFRDAAELLPDGQTLEKLVRAIESAWEELSIASCGGVPVEDCKNVRADVNVETFHHSNLANGNFRWAPADGFVFNHCDLRGTDFRGASLQCAQFTGSTFGIYVHPRTGQEFRTRFDDTPELRRAVAESGGAGMDEIEWVPVDE